MFQEEKIGEVNLFAKFSKGRFTRLSLITFLIQLLNLTSDGRESAKVE